MDAKGQYDEFLKHVKQINSKFKKGTSSLKPLFEVLDEQLKKMKIAALDEEKLRGKIDKDKRAKKYQAALTELFKVWNTNGNYTIPKGTIETKDSMLSPVLDEEGDSDVSPSEFVAEVREALEKFKEYASADVFMNTEYLDKEKTQPNWKTGFASCVNPKVREAVHERFLNYKKVPFGTYPQNYVAVSSSPKPGSEWQPEACAFAFKVVSKIKAGVCTQFALATAHVLTNGRKSGPRVEIVAYDNHVYVLVGRKGEVKNNKIPNDWHKQSDIVIVDGWAGAMGYPVIYQGLKNYPYGMIKDLDFIAAWPSK